MPSSLAVSRFLSTPSARRATVCHIFAGKLKLNFYPRPPRGGRPSQFGKSTSSQSISIHALREEGDLQKHGFKRRLVISIHALREEGDVQGAWNRRERVLISIHALREEGDPVPHAAAGCCRYFYPRPPRGGRRVIFFMASVSNDFYPRPPRGGRPELQCCCTKRRIFLSTPSARRATSFTLAPPSSSKFLSTPSARRATSTTSPRPGPGLNFYPRPPRGGRPRSRSRRRWTSRFLSTPSARRATDQLLTFCGVFDISIHALREEGDVVVPSEP